MFKETIFLVVDHFSNLNLAIQQNIENIFYGAFGAKHFAGHILNDFTHI